MLAGASVLITGGTGSFGNIVTRRLLEVGCREVRILSRDEAKQYAMRHLIDDRRLAFYLGDVRDRESVESAMRGMDMVFHAAALKQVPNCERFPEQAVMTNVFGSLNVMRAAKSLGVGRVVCLSTDKAVYPVNAMGMTKALMEKLLQAEAALSHTGTVLCGVRYGNVLCSRGSVVPLFLEQIATGRKLTVTVPSMTRFLLRLQDAVDLVERALVYGKSGDIFVRKSPACTIATLIDAIGLLIGRPCEVSEVGPRPGEKLHETLATAEEMRLAHDVGDAWRIPQDTSDLIDPNPHLRSPHTSGDYTSENTRQLNAQEVASLLGTLPEVTMMLDTISASALRAHRDAPAPFIAPKR